MSKKSSSLVFSQTLKSLIQNVFNQRQIQLVYQKIATRMAQYIGAREHGARNAATSFQQLIDLEIEHQKQGNLTLSRNIGCRKGCSYCCEQPVEITSDEAQLIAGYVDQNSIPISWTKLKRQAKWSSKQWRKKSRDERRCVFLSPSGVCRIYDFRPMSCRKLISLDVPSKCDNENNEVPEMFIVPESEVIATAAFNSVGSGILAKMLLPFEGIHFPRHSGNSDQVPHGVVQVRPDRG